MILIMRYHDFNLEYFKPSVFFLTLDYSNQSALSHTLKIIKNSKSLHSLSSLFSILYSLSSSLLFLLMAGNASARRNCHDENSGEEEAMESGREVRERE